MSGEAYRVTPGPARNRSRVVRVLMLGWEYPPRFAGGLGKACQGLAQAMARQGAHVSFVLPTFPSRIAEESLEVMGAREYLVESGWSFQPAGSIEKSLGGGGGAEIKAAGGKIVEIRSPAKLAAYGAPPEGPATDRIWKALGVADGGLNLGTGLSSNRPESNRPEGVWVRTEASLGSGAASASTPPGKAAGQTGGSEIYGANLWSEIERFVFSVRQLAETQEVDVVHAHDWMTFPAAFEYQRLTGTPVFLHVHATEYDRSGENVHREVFRIEREGFRRADHIFAVSRYTAGIIERLYGVDKRKISVVYNAPDDSAKERPSDQVPEPGSADRQDEVIFLGRLTFQKGPDHFLRAAALVAQVHPTARFVFCGTGDLFDPLRRLAHQLGIENRVHFAGFVNPSAVDEILKRSKVLVMPSVSEPFGLVALEAVHCGIPVVISKQSGVREVMHRALQVDFWDHEKLADQMLAALRLPDLSKQLVEDGIGQVQALSWDKSAVKVVESYRSFFRASREGALAAGGGGGRGGY